MPDWVVVETCPRHSSASNGLAERSIRTIGEKLRTLRYDTQNRCKTRITPESAIWPRMVEDTHVERVASHRSEQRMTEIQCKKLFRLQNLSCSRPWHRNNRGLSSGKRLHKGGDTAWEKAIWLGKSQTNPEHMVGTKSGAIGARTIRSWNRRNFQKLHSCSRYKKCPRTCTKRTPSWETQETPDTCTSHTTSPRKPDR